MLKIQAVQYFGDQAKLARFLDIEPSAVYQWGEVIPEKRAMQLERLTAGRNENGVVLKYDPSMYQQVKDAA